MILGIVQARFGGSRFPGKIMQEIRPSIAGRRRIGGIPMYREVLHRAKRVVDTVVLARADFFPTISEDDVLSRFSIVAQTWPEADTFVRFTADCPMLDTDFSRSVLTFYKTYSYYDIVTTSGDLDGLDTEVFSRAALREAHLHAKGKDREHVTSWMKLNLDAYTVSMPDFLPIRWSVDDPAGLEFVRRVFAACPRCREGVPHHTNAVDSIGGGQRKMILDLHLSTGGGLEECTASHILAERQGPQWRYMS